MTQITRPAVQLLRHVGLHTTEIEASAAFYAGPWGLEIVQQDDDSVYFRAAGPEYHVLELHRAQANALDHVAFGMASPAEVDAMARWVADEGVTLVFEPARMNRPGKGYGFRFIDPENRLIEVSSGVSALPELPTASHVPTRLAHVALNTTDIDATVDWYARVLGLRISDRSDDAMAFLHTRSDQLVIAFNQAEWAAPNHVAFEVSGMDAFQRHLTRLAAAGHDASWGPGRHSSMNNAFSYYVDPAGLVPEVTFDSSKIAEQAQMPHDGHRAAEPAEVLPAGGAPAPVMVKKLAGVPDPGWA